ncbi:PREDICTED: hemicentin-1 isoform X2 [Atta colombica]|uniref:hemicentin-1 isoform X2 n=1 Tax=Atta colombica TaxID=520822 RepID=UPI00084C72A4|nr:PREDICTED: hemicentin-1 isoform X2 [Atta colombica]
MLSFWSEAWLKTVKFAELGTEILLPCVLKSPQCDGLHSIKWYHGSTRIFIFSEDAGVIRGNNDIAARADIEYSSNSSRSYLKLSEIQLNNEGLYKCEATYMAVNRECNNVQHVLLNVTVQPAFVRVIDENSKNTLSTGATLGPINEGSTISLYCESGEGKPVPTVEWFKDDELLEATNSRTVTDTGIGTGSSLLEMQITREELGATFTCKVNNIALVEPLTVDINLDIHVRPLKMDLEGVVGHVVQGTKILLQCKVQAARPAANITWKNGTHFLSESNERFEMFETKIHENEDGTFETISYLAFTASVYDNGKTFKCYAENSVTRTEDLKPMKEATTIEVLYPPIIKMKPNNITVNETDDFLIFCDYEANPATLLKVTWLRDDDELVLNEEHYDGGITEQTALTVKNATPSDMGSYKCILENNAGPTISEATVQVSVFYKPVVEVIMDPETPVNEADRQNVSLTCEVDAGNPAILTAVRWYLDGDLLKELPDCSRNSTAMMSSEESLAFCDIDPSKLLLESVGRTFHGNYSCEGKNDAGWGPNSPSTSVIVYYKPGPASITYEPRQVVKKQALSITCFVLDPGRPRVLGFKWLRGWHRLPDENEATLFIESVNLETEANFTCLAYNEAGDGEPATTFIDVSVAPTFIKKLHSYRGYVYNAPNVSIMCWVECAPICTISWLRDDIPMNFTKTNRYYVSNVYHPPDPRTDDFESIQSTLIWNLTVWPNGQLDRAEDNVKFTCKSSSNGIGPGVESFTHFHVEFPPEDITISKKIINVIVDTVPETVECNAKARPKPNFRWYREGSTDIIMEGHVFDLKMSIPRRSSGTYYCEAWNRHGSLNISFIMNVQFKPECHIEKERFEGQDYVVCSAIANPKQTDFTWSLKNENDSLEQVAQIRNGKSYMLLDTSVTNFRTYVCVANNTVGHSVACERDIPGHIPWWHRLDGNLLLIIIVMTVIMILVLILICVAIYIVCRRKRSQLKYPNQAANNNHVNSVSEVLPDSGTKTFYENLPFHGIQAPPNKTDSLYNYKEHYQQQHRQEMQQYSYPLPSNSSNQLTLPLTSSLYHSSIVSPLQTSLVYTNNSRPSTLMHHEAATTGNHLSTVHQEQQQPNYGNSDARQSSTRRHAMNRRNERNRKYRKHERMSSDRNKSKQSRQRDAPSRRNNTSFVDTSNYETSFRQIPDLGVPETTYKISYPHYYEDDIAECSTDYHRPNPKAHQQQQQQPPWEHQSNRCTGNNTPQFAADAGDAKNRNKTSKTRLNDTRSIPSAPTIMQYAEFHFRDVGQEIDV